jgi:hypothetical protein
VKRDRRPPQLIRPPPRKRCRDCFQNHLRTTTVYPYDLQRDDGPDKSTGLQVRAVFAPLSSLGANREVPVLHRGRRCPTGVPLGTILPEFFADALPAIRGPSTASSSMRPGPGPTSSAPMAGDRENSARADKRCTGIGKRSHSLRPCGTTGSTRLASVWTDRRRKLQSLY